MRKKIRPTIGPSHLDTTPDLSLIGSLFSSQSFPCSCSFFEGHRPIEIVSRKGREWSKLSHLGRETGLSCIRVFSQ